MTITSIRTQSLEIQNLNDNNGYVTIKLEDVRIIRNYKKVLHIINTTEYQNTRDIIYIKILL